MAGRAPVESAAGQVYPADDGAADEAGLAMPAVHIVDLVAVREHPVKGQRRQL